MSYRLIIDPAASLDIMDSIRWYNKQIPGLGRRFYASLKKAMKIIRKAPEMFHIRYKTLRMVPLEKFPYVLIYQIDQVKKLVIIIAVLHTSRNPKIWEERII